MIFFYRLDLIIIIVVFISSNLQPQLRLQHVANPFTTPSTFSGSPGSTSSFPSQSLQHDPDTMPFTARKFTTLMNKVISQTEIDCYKPWDFGQSAAKRRGINPEYIYVSCTCKSSGNGTKPLVNHTHD